MFTETTRHLNKLCSSASLRDTALFYISLSPSDMQGALQNIQRVSALLSRPISYRLYRSRTNQG